MTITRTRGDNYPIEATIKINGVVVNLTGSVLVFSYIKDDEVTPSAIAGVIVSPTAGTVMFTPTVTDFTKAGTYRYDIQRISGGVVTTHAIDTLILIDDVTK